MNWHAKIYIEPTVEPVSITDFKDHARIDGTYDDAYVTAILKAARRYCERYMRRQLCAATWRMYMNQSPCGDCAIVLPYPPLLSVTSYQYNDDNGITQTWPSTEYVVDTTQLFGRMYPKDGYDYPSSDGTRNSVIITYQAGYGTTADSVPEDIKIAIKILASHWYEAREPIITGTIVSKVDFGIENILGMYCVQEPVL